MIPIAEAISGFYYYNKYEHNQPVINIRTEEQIREEQQAYNDIISGKYRSVMDRLEAIHQDHRIENIQAYHENEIKSGKYKTVMDRIEATRQ